MLKFTNLIAIVSMTIVLCYLRNSLAQDTLATFDKLHEAGKSLESASAKLFGGRNLETVYYFVRKPKSAICEHYLNEVMSVVDQYRIKALAFVKDSKQPKNWFSQFMRAPGTLMSMRSLSKNFPYLREATEALEKHSNVEPLSDEDVKCDLAKFQIDSFSKVLFVLQTEIKYLITEDPALVNRAILHQINEVKRTANHNFFGVKGPSPAQRQLLKDFYLARVDEDKATIGEAVEHFDEPSSLLLGRLYDSCNAFLTYDADWKQFEPQQEESCSKSRLASKKTDSSVARRLEYNLVEFCNEFLYAGQSTARAAF